MSAVGTPPFGAGVRTSVPPGPWTEHRNAQGRVYWYHQIEKRSVWEKPTELKSARERALDSTPWKEYRQGEKKYYVHSVTKESSWSLPKEVKDLYDAIPDESSPAPHTPTAVPAGSGSPFPVSGPAVSTAQRPLYNGPPPGFASPSGSVPGSASPAPLAYALQPQPSIAPVVRPPPVGASSAGGVVGRALPPNGAGGGEAAFMQLLRDKRIDGKWTWEATMREIITEPLYKALGTLAERKAAFAKHLRVLAEEAEGVKREQLQAMEPKIRAMMQPAMRSGGRVKTWLSYEGMLLRCPESARWKDVEDVVGAEEANELWERMRNEQREGDVQRKRDTQRRNKDVFMSLLKTFEADVTTRWKDAWQTVMESDEWKSDAQLREIKTGEMLDVFDELIRSLEKEKAHEVEAQVKKRRRDARQRRDWLRGVLQDGKQRGWLTIRTTFGEVYARLQGEQQLQTMLGQSGSTPLELFYDVMDEMDIDMGKVLRAVEKALGGDKPSLRLVESTTFDEFKATLMEAIGEPVNAEAATVVKSKTDDELRLVLEELVQLGKEETRRIERKLRHLGEDLRYALKKAAYHDAHLFEPESELDRSWDDVWRAKVAALKLREWDAFDRTTFRIEAAQVDEARKMAWQRFVERQKEKIVERKARAESAERNAASRVPRKRRGGEPDAEEDDGSENEQKIATGEPSNGERERTGRRSSATRRERRSGLIDEPSSVKKLRRDTTAIQPAAVSATTGGDDDSEKEEGEV